MKQRQFIKVIANLIEGTEGSRLETSVVRGITPLKRGQAMLDFVTSFLNERGITTFALHQRSEDTWATSPIMFLNQEPRCVYTFSFILFPQEDLGYHAKDLSPAELDRDMKVIQKIISSPK